MALVSGLCKVWIFYKLGGMCPQQMALEGDTQDLLCQHQELDPETKAKGRGQVAAPGQDQEESTGVASSAQLSS